MNNMQEQYRGMMAQRALGDLERRPQPTRQPLMGDVQWPETQSGLNVALTKLNSMHAQLEKQMSAIQSYFQTHSVSLNTLLDNEWELKHPINVTVEQRSGDDFIACLYDVDIYGYGENIPEALTDLREAIINQYLHLKTCDRGKLGKAPLTQLSFLESLIEEIHV